MRSIQRLHRFFLGGLGLMAAAGVAIHCAPSEDTSVNIVTQCDAAKLNAGDPAEATVKVYLETAAELQTRANALVERFKTVCNLMNTDLGLPAGADVHAACNPIAERIAKAANIPPVPDGGILKPVWASFTFEALTCKVNAQAQAKCLDTCSGQTACDPAAKCAPGKLSGTCSGECTGTCQQTGDAVPCFGGCFGKCAFPSPEAGPVDGGVPACGGECIGKCAAGSWLGRCSTGCGKGFLGQCLGTCTGSCDKAPYPTIPNPDAGDAADPEAGPPSFPGSGNCTGVCAGSCAGQASGACGGPCGGDFAGGACAGVGTCVGVCNGPAVPCTTTCAGSCQQHTASCTSGTCDKCSVALGTGTCGGSFDCGPANPICAGTCLLKGAMAATCGSAPVATVLAGDYKLYEAIAAHLSEFSAVAREANVINGNLAGVLQQTSGAFSTIGVVHDNARLCATSAGPLYEDARKRLSEAVSASLVVNGTKF